MKKLVCYFSASGTTKRYAEDIAKKMGAELFEIVPEEKYTSADLDYYVSDSRSSLEYKDIRNRPKIASKIEKFDDYDMFFVGFPIWWYTAPKIINSFLEQYDFSGKTIIVFATSGGSQLGKTLNDLKFSCKDAKLVEGPVLNFMSEEELVRWTNQYKE